jgi:hypothetical protein
MATLFGLKNASNEEIFPMRLSRVGQSLSAFHSLQTGYVINMFVWVSRSTFSAKAIDVHGDEIKAPRIARISLILGLDFKESVQSVAFLFEEAD